MIASQRKGERAEEVSSYDNTALSYIDHSVLEDMFGADDADWAIYRKIVSYFI